MIKKKVLTEEQIAEKLDYLRKQRDGLIVGEYRNYLYKLYCDFLRKYKPKMFVFENVDVACRINTYNDVTASYKWYSYRMSGMLIGRMTTLQENSTDVDPRGIVTINNVKITIGEWANYTYIWDDSLSKGCQRVEPGYAYDGVDVSKYPDAEIETIGFNTIIGENYMIQDNAKSNGSGKSSIFEALIWCLTGETIRGNKDVVNHNTEEGTEVTLSFTCDGCKYVISRYKEHKKNKNNLFINVNGEDKSGKGIRDSEKILESYLPELTASLIGSVIVLGQGMPSRFTNNAPSSRKEVLEKLTNSDFMIEDIKRRIQIRKTNLNTNLREVEDETLQLNTKINDELDVYTGKIKKFKALPGSMADNYAVRVTSIIREE